MTCNHNQLRLVYPGPIGPALSPPATQDALGLAVLTGLAGLRSVHPSAHEGR
jgi:hypothetical protein